MRPRRVLMTTDTVGGIWTYALELARGLSAADVEVMLVVIGPEPSPAQRAEAIEIAGLVCIVQLDLEWQDRAGPVGPEERQRLQELEQAFEPEIIHCNGYREAAAGLLHPWSWPRIPACGPGGGPAVTRTCRRAGRTTRRACGPALAPRPPWWRPARRFWRTSRLLGGACRNPG